MDEIALFVVYNHRYDANIQKIEKLYQDKFSHVFHLVPFYTGEKENVLPVYESSYRFQSYIAQAYQQIRKKRLEFTHYFIVADDLLINPCINETNLFEYFKIDKESSFIPFIRQFHELKKPWFRMINLFDYMIEQKGVEVNNIVPSYELAKLQFEKHGLDVLALKRTRLFEFVFWYLRRLWARYFFKTLKMALFKKDLRYNYPFVWGCADLFVVPNKIMADFCTTCGAFAATGLFVEIAIPTSLVLSSNKLVTATENNLKFVMNVREEVQEIEDKFGFDIDKLVNNFPDEFFFIHPIKLSKWMK